MRARQLAQIPDERAQHLLRVLVNRYIREGHPVGSRTLSRESGLEVSPATIRNIMADLEGHGFSFPPRTPPPARVPTIKGYRFFVDTLVKLRPPRETEVQVFEDALRDSDPQALVLSASNLLSAMTRLAGVVTIPGQAPQTALRQIEFLPLSNQRILGDTGSQ